MKKNFVLGVSLLVLVCGLVSINCATKPVAQSANSQQYDSESDFHVEKSRDGKLIMITKYVGSKQTVNIPPTIQGLPVFWIGEGAFQYKPIVSITIPNSVEVIDYMAFSDCENLTSITIPNSVRVIDVGAFASCTNLASVIIGNSVTAIGKLAFAHCTSLASITIPKSVTQIGDDAFYGCHGLTSVKFEGTIASDKFSKGEVWTFPYDLRDKFYTTDKAKGTPGTYTRTNDESETWTKQ